jgi:hypothetical protein
MLQSETWPDRETDYPLRPSAARVVHIVLPHTDTFHNPIRGTIYFAGKVNPSRIGQNLPTKKKLLMTSCYKYRLPATLKSIVYFWLSFPTTGHTTLRSSNWHFRSLSDVNLVQLWSGREVKLAQIRAIFVGTVISCRRYNMAFLHPIVSLMARYIECSVVHSVIIIVS